MKMKADIENEQVNNESTDTVSTDTNVELNEITIVI